jgi:hypothetical protein
MSGICKKCNAEVTQNYSLNCGHPAVVSRFNAMYLLHEIRLAMSFEKGFLFTIRELLTKPGKNIRDFLREDRNRLVKPVVF